MSTTSPVTSLEAAASAPCSCSSAIASGAHARPAMKVAVTATLKMVGLFVELNIRLIWAAQRFGSIVAASLGEAAGELGARAAPSIRRLPLLLNQLCELIEKIRGIMRAGRSFGMVLHAEDRQLLVAHSLHCAVIQIDVRYLYIGGERLRVRRESVILCSDGHFAGVQILYRLVSAAMAEF